MVEILRGTRTGRILGPRLAESDLVAPELLDVEVAAAFRRLVTRGHAQLSDVTPALDLLADWPIRRVSHRELVAASIRWWPNVTAYDAVYIATAVAYEASVITVDGRLSRAPLSDVSVENVRAGG